MGDKKKIKVVRSVWSRGVFENLLLVDAETVKTNKQAMRHAKKEYGASDPLACKIGGMCCLGFASLALGATRKQIRGQCMPSEVEGFNPFEVGLDEAFCTKAASINDDTALTEEQRERELINLCKKEEKPFVFEFVD